ncbi:sugar transferase [Jannaschia sp. KMU-145]|uniref:sugar transferase n=1 Tax=Jannaschia halovivens TaxID=3388667 RepID=UPI00396B155A
MHTDPHSIRTALTGAPVPLPQPGARALSYRDHLKRIFDVALVVLALPFVLPLVGLFALLVARDGGQAFYVQERLGLDGRRFRMWKLRSMVRDADAALDAHLAADPAARAEWARDQKLRHDPRVTRIGALIRKTSIDELPQLWNVLTGDMSLVGPRPMMPCQRAIYPGQAYFRLRPGLTGAWQVSGRGETSFAARAEFDRAYEGAVSLAADLSILAATVGVVLRATGR